MHMHTSDKIGVIVAALGTPDAPTAKALKPYLREFLSDMRVIDYPPYIWQPILRGIILNTRPRRSAKLYARIWTDEGSPLMVYSRRQVEGLQARLGDEYRVVLAMRYGNPSMQSAFAQLEAEGIDRILVFPMFPQFSSSTTSSIYDAAYRAAAGRRCPCFHERKRTAPTLRFVPPYYAHQGYIDAPAHIMKTHAARIAPAPEHVLFTYHGVPTRYVTTGDPYAEHCRITSERLADAIGLARDQWTITFQSRFGPEKWLEPATDDTLEHLGQQGVKSLLVACPGFTADCLETIDEIGNEGGEAFHKAGGGEFRLAPCVNDDPRWLDAMAQIARRETMGWTEAHDAHTDGHTVDRVVDGAGARAAGAYRAVGE